MTKDKENKVWLPKIDVDNLYQHCAYPISIYVSLSNRVKRALYESKSYLVDIMPDSEYKIDSGEENKIAFIKVNTADSNKCIIVPVLNKIQNEFNYMKNESQDIIKLDLYVINKEINEKAVITVFFDKNNEVYLSQKDMHIISKLQPNDIKDLILQASTEKFTKNKTRNRNRK